MMFKMYLAPMPLLNAVYLANITERSGSCLGVPTRPSGKYLNEHGQCLSL